MPFALLQLIANPLTDEFDSTRYLKAGGEVFAFLIACSWILTIVYNPSTIEDNPLKRRIGYNNFCVGFDTAPAKYFAFFLWPLSTYFNIRFAWLEVVTEYSLDEAHTSDTGKRLTVAASAFFILSVLLQTFILVFPPDEGNGVWIHTSFFVQYIVIRLLVVATQFYKNRFDLSSEDEDSITFRQWTWFYLYALVSLLFPLGVFSDFAYYDFYRPEGSTEILIPWYILCVVDYAWFLALATTAKFLPAHHNYRVKSVAKAQMKVVVTE